jgi:hypothetical protein
MGYMEPAVSDTEILEAVRRFELWRKVGLALALFGVLVAGALAVDVIPGGDVRFSQPAFLGVSSAAIISIVGGLVLLRLGRLPDEARTPRIAMLRAERLQGRRQLALLLMPVSLACMLIGATEAAAHVANGQAVTHRDMFVVGAFTVLLLFFAAAIAGPSLDRWARPVLDDELSRQLRGRALMFGYAILLPAIALLFAVGLVSRSLAIELVPVVAAVGVAGPAVRLFLLERAAGAGADEA